MSSVISKTLKVFKYLLITFAVLFSFICVLGIFSIIFGWGDIRDEHKKYELISEAPYIGKYFDEALDFGPVYTIRDYSSVHYSGHINVVAKCPQENFEKLVEKYIASDDFTYEFPDHTMTPERFKSIPAGEVENYAINNIHYWGIARVYTEKYKTRKEMRVHYDKNTETIHIFFSF